MRLQPTRAPARQAAIADALSSGLHEDSPCEWSPEPRVTLAEPTALIDRVRVALQLLGYDPALTQLEQSPNGKVTGLLRSGRFAHQSQLERQCELRNQLERELGPEAMNRIGLFVTLTPAEAE